MGVQVVAEGWWVSVQGASMVVGEQAEARGGLRLGARWVSKGEVGGVGGPVCESWSTRAVVGSKGV